MSEPQAPGPEGFAAHVERIFKSRWPERSVEIAGPMDLVVQGRHLGLENLWRIVSREPERQQEIITHYFEKLLEGDEVGNTHMPFRVVKPRIMPRIQPVGIFEHLDREQVAHVPFVNDTVIVFVMDLPEVTVSVTVEQMVRWGVQSEDLEQISRENLSRYRPDLQVRVVESETGGRAAILSVLDGYDAARLLLDTLHSTLALSSRATSSWPPRRATCSWPSAGIPRTSWARSSGGWSATSIAFPIPSPTRSSS